MGSILCPTRGGEASHPNQDRAIALAKERGEVLIFLYVSDVRFLYRGSGALLGALEDDLDEMGEFLLTMAQERAERQGVNAQQAVRRGPFEEAIKDVIEEHGVSTVVFGKPGEEHRITSKKYLRRLADSLSEKMEVEVLLTKNGELVPYTESDED
ncbi:MAG: universal stress protein [Anaerolineales bacterium]